MLQWFANRKVAGQILLVFAMLLLLNAGSQLLVLRTISRVANPTNQGTKDPGTKQLVESSLAGQNTSVLAALEEVRSTLDSSTRAQVEYLSARHPVQRRQPSKQRLGQLQLAQWRDALSTVRSSYQKYVGLSHSPTDPAAKHASIEFQKDIEQYLTASERVLLSSTSTNPGQRKKQGSKREFQRPQVLPDEADESEALAHSQLDLQSLFTLLSRPVAAQLAATSISPVPAVSTSLPPLAQRLSLPQQIEFALATTTIAGLLLGIVLARQVSRRLQVVAASAEQIMDVSSCVVAASRQQREAAGQQQEQLRQIADSMLEAGEKIKEITGHSLHAARLGSHVLDAVALSQSNMDIMLTQQRSVIAASGTNLQQSAAIAQSAAEIEGLISLIQNLARQTQVLARNSAAEAARLGEETGEYGVAAWEIGKLAERSTLTAQEIARRIQIIQENGKSADLLASETASRSQAGIERAQQTADSLRSIRPAIREISSTVAAIAASAGGIAAENETATALNIVSELGRESVEWARATAAAMADLAILAAELQNASGQCAASAGLPVAGAAENFPAGERSILQAVNRTEALRMPLHPKFSARLPDHESAPQSTFPGPSSVSAEQTG